jgi:hypothetical protein
MAVLLVGQILGRAPTISSFVRQGSDEAYTEIELKGPIGKPNRVIRRDFNKSNKKSVWHLDGASIMVNIQ